MKIIYLCVLLLIVTGCASNYEASIYPDGNWHPVNKEYFGIPETERVQLRNQDPYFYQLQFDKSIFQPTK